ncbi:40S ribosomal protein S27-2, partial [Tanacetum coccineum]
VSEAAAHISKPKSKQSKMTLPNDVDLLNPPADLEKRKHKLKRLVQSPNSFFMDVKCQEPLCSATHKQLWCVETARPCCASRQVAVQDSLRDALSAGREIDGLIFVWVLSCLSRRYCGGYCLQNKE